MKVAFVFTGFAAASLAAAPLAAAPQPAAPAESEVAPQTETVEGNQLTGVEIAIILAIIITVATPITLGDGELPASP